MYSIKSVYRASLVYQIPALFVNIDRSVELMSLVKKCVHLSCMIDRYKVSTKHELTREQNPWFHCDKTNTMRFIFILVVFNVYKITQKCGILMPITFKIVVWWKLLTFVCLTHDHRKHIFGYRCFSVNKIIYIFCNSED